MKRKAAEKLFDLIYTDAMTGVCNRTAYEEQIKRLKRKTIRLDNITVVVVKLDDLNEINYTLGNRTGDEVVKHMADCIIRTIGEKANIYRMGDDEFLCIADNDVMPYISELRDLISFEGKGKPYPFYASIGYMTFDNRKQKNIDDLIKDCDRKMIKLRKAELM